MKVVLIVTIKGQKNSKGRDTCYSAAYMSQTQEQQRFTISEAHADISVHYAVIHCPH